MSTAIERAALLAALAACSNEVTVRPVIESPPPGTNGAPFAGLETIEMTITLDGESEALATATFKRGEALELTGVPYGESLVLHLLGRSSGAEVAYGRTCRFAVRADEDPPEPRLYFANTVRWSGSAMPGSGVRIGGTAVTSRAGAGLYLGGSDETAASIAGADRFDPTTGAFATIAEVSPRIGGGVGVFGDGRVFVVGGRGHDDTAPLIDLISIDASAVDHLDVPELRGVTGTSVATLSNGRLLVVGGRNHAGSVTNIYYEIDGEGAGPTVRMIDTGLDPNDMPLAKPRYGHTVTRLSEDLGAPVLIAGGRDGGGTPVASAELYRPITEDLAPPSEFARAMAVPRWDHLAVRLADGSIGFFGGRNASGPVRSIEAFRLDTGFVLRGIMPGGAGVTDFTITQLPDQRLLFAGGRDMNGDPVATAYIFRVDSFDGSYDLLTTDLLSVPRAGHTATLLCDGTVMLVGGTTEPTPAERYNPPSAGRR